MKMSPFLDIGCEKFAFLLVSLNAFCYMKETEIGWLDL